VSLKNVNITSMETLVQRCKCRAIINNHNWMQLAVRNASLLGSCCRRKKRIKFHVTVAQNHGVVQFSTGIGRPGYISFPRQDVKIIAAVPSLEKGQTTMQKLASAGLAGLVAYGLSNTIYYSVAFLVAWITMSHAPRGQGVTAAVIASAKLIAVVWAGSQLTKLPRMAAALVMAPLADKLLMTVQIHFKLKSKKDALVRVILPACLAFAFTVFVIVLFLWA
jgi:hypothetical protein